jgi:hypothetical protein
MLGGFLLLILLASTAFAQMSGPDKKDVLGWQETRWGMTQDELFKLFSDSIVKRSQRNFYLKPGGSSERYGYVDYVIPEMKVAGDVFEVSFVMDIKTYQLIEVDLSLKDYKKAASTQSIVFDKLEELLTQKYGPPTYKNESITSVVNRVRHWAFHTTTIKLDFHYMKGIDMTIFHLTYEPSKNEDLEKL